MGEIGIYPEYCLCLLIYLLLLLVEKLEILWLLGKFYQMWDKTKALTIDHGVVCCPFKSRCILSV